MRYANHGWLSIGAAAAAWGVLSAGWSGHAAAADAAAAAPADAVGSVWQHHKVTFNYMAFTSLYTCSGLEDQVRRILLHLGARKDVKVSAVGCPGPDNTPSRDAWVDADFYSLVPAADEAGSDSVKARWTSLEMSPRRPSFMGDGDCELMERMKDTIIKNFSLRGVEYRTDCVPHQLWPEGYSVKGQTLQAVAPASSAVKS
jgi:hypothetical protein